jgi:hypothetical protein
MAWCGVARLGAARPGKAKHATARQGNGDEGKAPGPLLKTLAPSAIVEHRCDNNPQKDSDIHNGAAHCSS